MEPNTQSVTRPEAMGDVPGICELPLTRAVVQYRDVHEMDTPGGRIQDIGLALVVEGRYAATSEVIDLGSAQVKVLDLSTELVVLDWVYEPTLDHVSELITAVATLQEGSDLERYASQLGLRILERVGFGPLSRPTFLRIGFRDICRDLDLHEGTSIRFVLGPGRLTRAHLDYDTCALVFRTAFPENDVQLEHSLAESFPGAHLWREAASGTVDSVTYHVRFPLPTTLVEAREVLARMRRGLAGMMARFEPSRFESLDSLIDTFGARETLAGLHIHEAHHDLVQVPPPSSGSQLVH